MSYVNFWGILIKKDFMRKTDNTGTLFIKYYMRLPNKTVLKCVSQGSIAKGINITPLNSVLLVEGEFVYQPVIKNAYELLIQVNNYELYSEYKFKTIDELEKSYLNEHSRQLGNFEFD